MKTSELSGVALDWAAAKAAGHDDYIRKSLLLTFKGPVVRTCNYPDTDSYWPYSPSTDWSQGGQIIEDEGICLMACSGVYQAFYDGLPISCNHEAPSALVAAMRCFVEKTLGAEVEIPATLI
jgi:hypothetical protein